MENFNLWRKLWRKALRHNFIRHKLICDGQKSVTIFCDGNTPSQKFCDGNCDGLFPSQKNLWRKVRHNFQRWNCPRGVILWRTGWCPSQNCDGIRHFPSQFVTEWWESVTICDGKLWRNSVTIWFCDRIPSQIPSQNFEFNEKNLFETFMVFQLNATVQCNTTIDA